MMKDYIKKKQKDNEIENKIDKTEYLLLDEQINEINKIEHTIKQNYELNIFLFKKMSVDFIYNTCALEGNIMTYPEVQTLLDGITVGGHKLSDEQQILNQKDGFDLLVKKIENKSFLLNKKTSNELNGLVTYREALKWGEFRDDVVGISGTTSYLPPLAEELDTIYDFNLKQLNKINNPINRAVSYFLIGAKNQYYFDGNKRTSRLMMNGELLSNGYPMLNLKVRDSLLINQTMLDYYETNNIVKAFNWVIDYYQKDTNAFYNRNNEPPIKEILQSGITSKEEFLQLKKVNEEDNDIKIKAHTNKLSRQKR